MLQKVNDVEISGKELDFNFSQQRQRMLEQYGGKLPFEESVLKKQVLEQLVNRKIIEVKPMMQGIVFQMLIFQVISSRSLPETDNLIVICLIKCCARREEQFPSLNMSSEPS